MTEPRTPRGPGRQRTLWHRKVDVATKLGSVQGVDTVARAIHPRLREQSRPLRAGLVDWRFVLLGSLLGFAALEILYFSFRPNGLWGNGMFYDGHTFLNAARDWMAGRGFYEAWQFAPYRIQNVEILYPPSLLVLLVPFTFLPDPVWIAVPLAITAWIVWSWRPSYWGWVAIALCLCYPYTFGNYLLGNPAMWVTAIVALATRWPAFGPLIIIKPAPTLLPFALVGVRHRAWWLSFAGCIAFVALTFPMSARLCASHR